MGSCPFEKDVQPIGCFLCREVRTASSELDRGGADLLGLGRTSAMRSIVVVVTPVTRR